MINFTFIFTTISQQQQEWSKFCAGTAS